MLFKRSRRIGLPHPSLDEGHTPQLPVYFHLYLKPEPWLKGSTWTTLRNAAVAVLPLNTLPTVRMLETRWKFLNWLNPRRALQEDAHHCLLQGRSRNLLFLRDADHLLSSAPLTQTHACRNNQGGYRCKLHVAEVLPSSSYPLSQNEEPEMSLEITWQDAVTGTSNCSYKFQMKVYVKGFISKMAAKCTKLLLSNLT